MASFRNITVDQLGNNVRVQYEWNVDDQSGPWTSFEAQFPRDLDSVEPEQREALFFEVAQSVARQAGIHD